MSQIAIYPGTFDPPTLGHLDIISAASKIFGRIVWLIAVNPDKKTSMFSPGARKCMMQKICTTFKLENVEVREWLGFIGDFDHQNTVVQIRSFRNSIDVNYEMELCMNNRQLFPAMQTIFIPTLQEHMHISSTIVRQLIAIKKLDKLGQYVPECIVESLKI